MENGMINQENGRHTTWIDLLNPSATDIAPYAQKYGLHPLAIEDCLHLDQLPKMDHFPEALSPHLFMIINDFFYNHQTMSLELQEIDCFLGADFLITIHKNPFLLTENEKSKFMESLGNPLPAPEMILHKILDHVIDRKLNTLETIEDSLYKEEDRLLNSTHVHFPSQMKKIRQNLFHIRKSIFYEREVISKICRRDSNFIKESTIYYYRDLHDHLTKLFESIEILKEEINSLFDLYFTLRNNRMTEASHQTNKTVKRLTLITALFAPLTLLTGIGGMSEWTAFTAHILNLNIGAAYGLFTIFLLLLAGILFATLKWLRWW